MTSKYGFSVVAPMSVTAPSRPRAGAASCWALLKRWISSRKRIVRCPVAPSRSRARAITAPHVGDRRRDGRELLEGGPGRRSDDPRERRLPASGRAVEDRRADPVLLDRAGERRALADDVSLADEARPGVRGRTRAASGAPSRAAARPPRPRRDRSRREVCSRCRGRGLRSATRRPSSSGSCSVSTPSTRRGTRRGRPSSCAPTWRPRGSSASSRARARAGEPGRAHPRPGRTAEPSPPLPHRHGARPTRPSGRSTRGRATCSDGSGLGPRRARHEEPGGSGRGRDRVARARGLPARRRPRLRRLRRRGGRASDYGLSWLVPRASRRGPHRLLRQRGRRRPRRRRRSPGLLVLDRGEDELAVPPARPRPQRPCLHAGDRGQRAREGGRACSSRLDRLPARLRLLPETRALLSVAGRGSDCGRARGSSREPRAARARAWSSRCWGSRSRRR